MHAELFYGLSIASKLKLQQEQVGSLPLPG
mgnify:CR=1 FL=1|jgi:hypothetical protein